MNLILDRFKAIERQVGDQGKLLSDRLSEQDTVLAEIRTEVKTTNGRVTKIETEQAQERNGKQERRDRFRDRVNLTFVIVGAAIAGGIGPMLHAAGVW